MENRGGELTELGRIKELSADDIDPAAEYTLQVGDLESGKESAANLNFRDKSTFSMRLWVRLAISLLPMILLIFALIIQRKKFIIDEDYYDMMVKEIAEREKAQEV